MPVEKSDFYITFGEFQPSDSQDIVLELSRLRIRQISKLLNKTILFPENDQLVRDMQFHTFEDFILTQKHAAPSKVEYIPTGHSLHRHDANLAGYLAHIHEHDPDLADFFLCDFRHGFRRTHASAIPIF